MKRIRYTEISNGMFISSQIFKNDNDKEFQVVIDTKFLVYDIFDPRTKITVYAGGRSKNLRGIKKEVKKTLIEYGVNFDEENRDID